MAAIILFTLSIWVLSAVIRNADQKRQAARIAQVKAEQARQREELKRQREESKRQARQLDKHEAWLMKHESEIRKLNSRMTTAEMQINRYKGLLSSQTAEMNVLDARYGEVANELDEIESLPFATRSEAKVKELRKEKERIESKLKTLDNQIFSSKLNLKKATDVYNDMRIKLEEVA